MTPAKSATGLLSARWTICRPVTSSFEWRIHRSTIKTRWHLKRIRGWFRTLPHVPGIDAAGSIVESNDARYQAGQEVVITGYELDGRGGADGRKDWCRRIGLCHFPMKLR